MVHLDIVARSSHTTTKTTIDYACHRGARPSSYTFGFATTRTIKYKIFNISYENSVPFSLPICLGVPVS